MLQNKRIPEEQLLAMRPEVLAMWPTGQEVDLDEALAYRRQMPDSRVVARKYREFQRQGKTLVQPRGGMATLERQKSMVQYLETNGADFVPMNLDNYTRALRFGDAEKGLKRSLEMGRDLLNGFPVVSYGVKNCRTLLESVDVPSMARVGDFDCRLVYEIAAAAGFNYSVGGGIGCNLSYNKNIPMERSFGCQLYIDRLAAYYEENGAPMARQYHMTLTGTLVPHSMALACLIIEGLIGAEQGVKCITQQFGLSGCLVQDVAAIQVLRELSREYLRQAGHGDVTQVTGCAQWMGAFPMDEDRAFGVISICAAAAALGRADMTITKSPQEAFGIPTQEANAAGVKATKQVIDMLQGQELPMTDELQSEIQLIRAETQCILEKVFELGEGDVLRGAMKAIDAGVIDIPFSPSIYNAGKAIPVRDARGAVRLMDFGNVPFTREIKDLHRQKLGERGRKEGRKIDWRAVQDDIVSFALEKLA